MHYYPLMPPYSSDLLSWLEHYILFRFSTFKLPAIYYLKIDLALNLHLSIASTLEIIFWIRFLGIGDFLES